MFDRPRPSGPDRALSIFLFALAACGYLLFGWSIHVLKTVPTAPLACAHEAAQPQPTALQDEVFVSITSAIERPVFRGSVTVDSNAAICVLRASDGAIVGHYALGENVNILSLAQADGVLYYLRQEVIQQTQAVSQNQLCAMRASSGTRLWCQVVQATNFYSYQGLQLIARNGTVYLLTQAQAPNEVFAFRASSGALLWQRQGTGAPFAVGDDAVYGPTTSDEVCALRASDGTSSWCTTINTTPQNGQESIAAVATDATGVYALGRDGLLAALRPADGGILWQRALHRAPLNLSLSPQPLIAAGGVLYISGTDTTSNQPIFSALRASDGTTLWETSAGTLPLTATADNGAVYLSSGTILQAFQATSGTSLWKQSANQYRYKLALGGNVLYLADSQGNLSAYDKSDGKLLWQHTQCAVGNDTAPQQANGATIWCGWGTDSAADNGAGWSLQSTMNSSQGVPGVLATGA